MKKLILSLSALSGLTHVLPAFAHEAIEEVVVEGRREVLVGEARTASEGRVGQMDLALRPILRPGDLLEAVPGMIVTQHSGSGKSNQMFLRGFNLDHGTDFATWIDGMPVNMRTHGHGQGYTDVNFLIPETVRTLNFVKGPYHAELGDFSAAGGAQFSTFSRFDENIVSLGLGENNYGRVLAMGSVDAGPGALSGVLELQQYDGPWTDIKEDVEKTNGLVRYGVEEDSHGWQLTGMFYDNTWNSADQIPSRAVEAGLIDELGSIDDTLGGESSRYSLSGNGYLETDSHRSEFALYAIDYDMTLWSNFTYLLDEPVLGDQFQQTDERKIYGGHWRGYWLDRGANNHLHHSAGIEWRYDDVDEVGLARTVAREAYATVRTDAVEQGSIGAFYQLDWRLTQNLRTILALRGDYYEVDVSSDNPLNSGDDSDWLLSPKLSLIYSLNDVSELYASAGRGFHSNDGRGVVQRVDPVTGEAVDQADFLVRSDGAELGFKTTWLDIWNTSLALWYLELDSELVYVGDAGTTEAGRPSERWGVEFNNHWQVDPVWALELDLAWTDAKFADSAPEGNRIPGALEFVASAAVTASLPSGWFGSLRARHFGGAPLIEDNSVKSDSSNIVHLLAGWSNQRWRVQAEVLNLLDSDDRDIEYFYASRLPGEPADGVEDRHYHVFEPRQLRASVTFSF